MPVSVVIPSLNEEARVEAAIRSAWRAGAGEVIVVDGGSSDGTVAVARRSGAAVLEARSIRGEQSNAGAASAEGEILLFLHADTLLPAGACRAVEDAIGRGTVFGGFRVRFAEPGARLRFVARAINLRTSVTRAPWGDQAQFVRAGLFRATGGFLRVSLMEDYELAIRMKRLGPTELLPLHVVTSGRRFLQKGIVRTALTNWAIVTAWRLGATPDRLARWYRRT